MKIVLYKPQHFDVYIYLKFYSNLCILNLNSFIFSKKKNTSFKEIPFNVSMNASGETKYLPPVSKE
jgi:hypothetical protein